MSAAESSFYVTGGTLRHDAPCYVERQADRELLDALSRGEFCYALTSRQMGKSSLMVRTAIKLRQDGLQVAVLDLTAIGQNLTPEQWYDGLLLRLGHQLGLEEALEAYSAQHARLGPCRRFFAAIEHVVMPSLDGPGSGTGPGPGARPLVLFIDEIDVVRSLPFSTDEFFAAIRECYNRRVDDARLERLTFCLLGVGSPSDLIRDTRMTPFNIGRRIELNDFTAEESRPLALGLEGQGKNGWQLLLRVLFWTGGHPYLTQRLCQAIAAKSDRVATNDIDGVCRDLFLSHRAREKDDNLIFVRERLLRNEGDSAGALTLYRKVLKHGRSVPDDETNPLVSLLRLSGIVRVQGGSLAIRNRIYGRAFDGAWIESHLPGAEVRRQREAYRRGLIRATTVAAAIFLAMAALVVWVVRSRNEAKAATWAALRDRARLSRMLGLAGQRFAALGSIQQAAAIDPSPELRNEAIACLALPDLRRETARLAPDKDAVALAISSDQQFYAFGNPAEEIVVRRAADDREIARWPAGTKVVRRLLFSRDNELLAVIQAADGATVLSVWRWSSPKKLFSVTNDIQAAAFDFSPDSRQLSVGDEHGMLRFIALPEGQVRAEAEFGQPCSVLRFDSEGRHLAVASSASLKMGVYDAASGNLLTTLHSASPPIHLAWHPAGRRLAAAGEDRRVRLWDHEADAMPIAELPRQMSDITALAFSRSGDFLVSASTDRSVRLWDAVLGRLLLTAPEVGDVRQLQFSPDDRRLGFAVSGGAIQFWEMAFGEECRMMFDFDAEELSAIDVHPGGRLLATAHGNGVTFWDLARARRLGGMAVGGTAALRFHPRSGELVDGEFRGTYRFRVESEARSGEQALLLKPREDFYLGPGTLGLDFARDKDVLAVLYDDRVRLARDTNSAYAVLGELVGEPGFKTVAISPDGQRVAAGNWKSGEVWVWDPALSAKPRRLRVEGGAHVRFSPEGRWLATGTERKAVLWDTDSWKPAVQVDRPRETTRPAPVAFAKDGRMWALGWDDKCVRLLEISGRTIADLEAPGKELLVGLAFSPDGSRLACATAARTIVMWDLDALGRGLAHLGLGKTWEVSAAPRPRESSMSVRVGPLDRLRFSQARPQIELRREVADLDNQIRENADAWHLYRFRAEKLQQLGEFEAAERDYQRWIQLDRAAVAPPREAKLKAWPLRDLARLYLCGQGAARDYAKAQALTEEALDLEPENPDNHFRHAIACFRLGHYTAAESHFESARKRYETSKKSVTAVLFYLAMCKAHLNDVPTASELLEQAKRDYARTDLKYRESHATELSDLLWEAERVVSEAGLGG